MAFWSRRPKEPTLTEDSVKALVKTEIEETGSERQGFEYGVPRGGLSANNAASSVQGDRKSLMEQLFSAYKTCPWVSAAVDVIARTVTAGGLQIVLDDDMPEGTDPVDPPPVTRLRNLLEWCNPREDLVQLLRKAIIDLMVFGDAYIEVVKVLDEPVALYSLDSVTMAVLADEHGELLGYQQGVDGLRTQDFKPDEVIHIQMDSARGGLYGIGPTERAMLPITSWLFWAATIKETGRRGDPPRVHVDLASGTKQPDQERWLQQYQINNIGPRAIGNPLITVGAPNGVKELSTHKTDDAIKARDKERDAVLAVYGVPPRKVGVIEPGSLGGSGSEEGQNRTFEFNTINPIANLLLEKLNFIIVDQGFGIQNWHLEFAEVDYRDSKVVEDIRQMRVFDGGYTVNRLRDEIGEPSVDGGDDAFIMVPRLGPVLVSDLAAMSKAGLSKLVAPTGMPPGPGGLPMPADGGMPPDDGGGGAPPALAKGRDRPGGPGDAALGTPPKESVDRLTELLEALRPIEIGPVVEDAQVSPKDIAKAVALVKAMPNDGDANHVKAILPTANPEDILPTTVDDWRLAKLTTVKIKDVRGKHGRIARDNLIWHLTNPGKSQYTGPTVSHPLVLDNNGKLVVIDGNHRVTSDLLLGQTKTPAWVLDAKDLKKESVPDTSGLEPPPNVRGPDDERRALEASYARAFQARRRQTLKQLPSVEEAAQWTQKDIAAAIAAVKALPVDDKGRCAALLTPYDDDIPDISIEQWNELATQQTVNVADLQGHHKHVKPDRLVWHLQHLGDPSVLKGPAVDCPFVYKDSDGCLVVADGDHRVTALKLAGAATVKAWVLDDADL